jgi:hypothetical protein
VRSTALLAPDTRLATRARDENSGASSSTTAAQRWSHPPASTPFAVAVVLASSASFALDATASRIRGRIRPHEAVDRIHTRANVAGWIGLRRTPLLRGFSEAAEGTRTLNLLHGKRYRIACQNAQSAANRSKSRRARHTLNLVNLRNAARPLTALMNSVPRGALGGALRGRKAC